MEDKKIMEQIKEKYNRDFFIGQSLMKGLDYLISNPPTYTIMNKGTLSNNAISLLDSPDFKKAYPVYDEFQGYIERILTDGNNIWDFLNNPRNAIKDVKWTKERNKEYEYEAYVKYSYTPELKEKIITLLREIRNDLQTFQAARKRLEAAKEAEREKARKEFRVEILEKSTVSGGEGGPDPYAKVRITDPATGESKVFRCRNIFDFGFVVNPEGGGLAHNVEALISRNPATFGTEEQKEEYRRTHPTKTGWGWKRDFLDGENWIEMTDFEIRAVKYLHRFSPINTHIRM